MTKRLFVTDLDGTALGGYEPYDHLPEKFCALLDRLVDDGWEWALNTTWDPEGQWKMVCQSPVRSRPTFLIGEYGRSFVRVKEDRTLATVEPYCSIQKKRLDDFCIRKMFPVLNRAVALCTPDRIFFYGHMLHIICRPETDTDSLRKLCRETADDSEWTMTLKENVFVARPSFLNKALPMYYLRNSLGYAPENLVTAGDNTPDLDMMSPEFSAVSLCPGNAGENVKQFVLEHGGIVGTLPYSDGVIEAFHLFEKRFM